MPHIHEKIDFCSEVFIVHKNKVLLRKHDKYKIWLSVGGHIELDEDPNEAAIREVREEVGLEIELFSSKKLQFSRENIREIIPPEYLLRQKINETHEHIIFVYFAKTKNTSITLSKTEKTEGTKWFTLKDLTNPQFNLNPDIAFYAKDAIRKLKTTTK